MGKSRACLLFISLQLISMATAQELDKRVPQGFVGMRGKKYLDDDSTEQFYKRKPQFFVGVKGKKGLFDIMNGPDDKRAPTGFMGMRGKKDVLDGYYDRNFDLLPKRDGSLIGQIDYSSGESEPNSFPILNEILSHYLRKIEMPTALEESDEAMTNEVDKRAANIHQFFGVRGKKSLFNKRPYDVTFRGKFIGVRGKKDLKNTNAQEIKFLLDNGPLLKRKGQMGFIGMRGKKWLEGDDTSSELETV